MKDNMVNVLGVGDKLHSEILALQTEKEIVEIYSDNESEIGTNIGDYKILSKDNGKVLAEYEIVIVNYYWKEKARQLFNDYGIEKAKVFQWKDDNKKEYYLKDINCKPLYYNFKPCEAVDKKTNASEKQKKSSEKHVLVLAYYYPPIGGSPIQRTLKYVKYLSQMGYRITIVTVDESNNECRDKSLLDEIPANVKVVRFANAFTENDTLSLNNQKRIYKLLCNVDCSKEFLDLLYSVQQEQIWYPLPDRLILWATEVYEKIEEYVDMSDVDVLYSTVPEWSPHLLGYLLKQKYGIPWVADYRDPWTISKEYVCQVYPFITTDEYEWQKLLEQKLVLNMDAMIQLDDYIKELYEREDGYDIRQSSIFIIPNGYDEDDFRNIKIREGKNSRFTLCYNGSLGYSRKPKWVLQAVNELISDGYINKNEILWIFNGPTTEKKYREEIELYDEYGITRNNGLLPHVESIQVASDADVMVVYGEYGEVGKQAYTGKFMEYLRIGRPILSFSSTESPINRILNETNLGRNYSLEDVKGIKEFLIEYYNEWKKSGEKKPCYDATIEKYSRRYLSEQLAKVIEGVCKIDKRENEI